MPDELRAFGETMGKRLHREIRAPHPQGELTADQRGFTVLEALLALALVGIILVGILGALGTSSQATLIDDEQTTGDNLAESQLEHLRGQAYDSTGSPPQYSLISAVPEGYSISLAITRLDPEGDGAGDDDGLQKAVVTVQHRNSTVATLEAYKVR